MAKHIFKDEIGEAYAKIKLVTFSSYDVKDFDDVNTLPTKRGSSKMVNYALIAAMSHFTKDNGLKKEIYLITDRNKKRDYP